MRDLDGLLDTIATVYEAGMNPTLWPEALRKISDPLNVAGAGIMLGDPDRQIGMFATRNMDAAFRRTYDDYYHRLDPVIPRVMALSVGSLVTSAMVSAPQSLERTEFYQDWLRPQGLHDGLVCNCVRAERSFGVLALSRSKGAGAFDAAQLEALGRVMPHLQRAISAQLRLNAGRLHNEFAAHALEQMPQPVLLLDYRARVLFANRAAEKMLRISDGLGTDADGLTAATRAGTSALRRLVANAAGRRGSMPSGGSLQLARPSGRRAISVLATPLHTASLPARIPVARPSVMLLVTGEPAEGTPIAGPLRTLYGLTQTEAAVAAQVARGIGLKAAAAALGIAPSTARTHLSRVFAKTETGRQSELAALLASLAAPAGP